MHNESEPRDGFAHKAILFIPLVLAALLFLIGLTRTDLWTPDEPRYALVAREMLDRGSILQPYCNGQPYTEKPPLFFWLIMLGAKVFGGVNQLAVRLPSVLSALGTIALLIAFVRQFVGRKAAAWSAAALALSPLFFWLARSGHIDMLLTFLVTAGLVSFYRWHVGGRWGYLVIFYASLAFGTLAKGPVGLVLPLLVAAVFLLLKRKARDLLRMRPYIGLPLAIAAVLAWYIPASAHSAGYGAGNVVGRQIVERVLTADHHSVSVWMWPFAAAISLAWGMAPWSLLLPFAAVIIWRQRRSNDARLFLLAWAIAILGFFTVISSKRELYLLPMLPACAAMAGIWLAEESEKRVAMLRWMVIVLGIVAAVGAAVGMAVGPPVLHKQLPEVAWPLFLSVLLGAGICAGVCLAVLAARARSGERIGAIGSALLAGVLAATALFVLPWIDESKTPRHLCETYQSLRTDDSRLGMLGANKAREEFVFYSHTQIELVRSAAELDAFFISPARRFCFASREEFDKISGALKSTFYITAEHRVSSQVMLLLCNQNVGPRH